MVDPRVSTEQFAEAAARLGSAFAECGIAAAHAAKAMALIGEALVEIADAPKLRSVATDRQWNLYYRHRSARVRKKWRNALYRKVRIEEKRCRT